MQQRTFNEELKYQWRNGGMHLKLIGINVFVFLLINVSFAIGNLFIPPNKVGINPLSKIIDYIFLLRGDWYGILTRPWGLITSIFSHYEFMHLLFNMIFLYFISRFFLHYFSNQRLLYTYILGGIAGGLLQFIAYTIFPAFQDSSTFVVGASGAVNAVFMAAAFYRPMVTVRLFGLIRVKMIYLALIFFFMDLMQMSSQDNVAHFAHLGGAAFGILSIQNMTSRNNIITFFQRLVKNFKERLSGKPRMKTSKGGARAQQRTTQQQTDAEYNAAKKRKQEEIDAILDKISKSGYDSLTKREKALLFDQSQK